MLVNGIVRHKCLAVPFIIGRRVACQVGGWSIQTRNDGVDKVETLLQQGDNGTVVAEQRARITVQTGVMSDE